MKHGSTFFLKVVTLFIAACAVAVLVWFPQTEGRAANLDVLSIYRDPFILYMYLASIPFFVALVQAMRVLGLLENDRAFSTPAVEAVRTIKRCAIATMCFLVVAIVWVRFASGDDDPAGAVALGICMILVSIVIATATAVFQMLLQSAVDLKSGNDYIVSGSNT